MSEPISNQKNHLFYKLTKGFRAELSKLQKMSLKDKLWYIWEYYKFPIVAILITLCMAVSLLGNLSNQSTPYLRYAIINLTTPTQEIPAPLTTDFHNLMQLGETDSILYEPLQLSLTDDYATGDMQAMELLYLRIAAQEVDVLISSEADYRELESLDAFANLEEILPSELWSLVKNDALYTSDPETGKSYPCGLMLQENPTIQKCDFLSDSVVLGIIKNSQRLNHVIQLVYYLYGVLPQ